MRCTAHLRDGSGRQCKKPAKKGMNICGSHGGSAPQTIAAAERRLLAAADPAAAELVELALNGETPSVKLGAIKELLERAQVGGPKRIAVEGGLNISINEVDIKDLL